MKPDSSLKPIRILFFTGHLYGGGTEHYLAQLLQKLNRKNFHVELALLRGRPNPLIASVRNAGIQVHDLQCDPGAAGAVRAIFRLRNLIEERQPDILHSFGYPCDIYAAGAALFCPDVWVLTSRRGNQPLFRRRMFYRLTNPLVDRVVCVSSATAAYAQRTEGLPEDRAIVLCNGVDISRFPSNRGRVVRVQTIGTLGRLRSVKGSDLLIEAFERLNRSDLKLLMAGEADGPWGQKLRTRHEGTPGLTFLGRLMDHEIPDFLRLLDLFVLPSRSEGMSNALLEAMASGLPVIATDVGSNREVLENGAAGILVEPDPQAIAMAIESLIVDPGRATVLGLRARQRAAEVYGFDRAVCSYESFYSGLLGREAHASPELVATETE